jgi:hypothetical protein
VIEFESRVNDVWRRYDDAVICTYHLAQLSGDAVINIMRTHPMVEEVRATQQGIT